MATNHVLRVNLSDHSEAVLRDVERCLQVGLEKVGNQIVTHAKENCPVDNGVLRSSIESQIVDNTIYVGSALHYAPYVEYGTGSHAEDGNGRQGWWVFIKGSTGTQSADDDGDPVVYSYEQALKIFFSLQYQARKGEADYDEDDVWLTDGQEPTHFLMKAVTEHDSEYERLLKESFVF